MQQKLDYIHFNASRRKEYNADEDAGGGATAGRVGGDQFIWISGNEYKELKDTEGKPLSDKPADILAHELVGHAIPKAVKSEYRQCS